MPKGNNNKIDTKQMTYIEKGHFLLEDFLFVCGSLTDTF